MLRLGLAVASLTLASCARTGPNPRPPACADSAPGRGTYEMERVGGREAEAATVVGLLSDVDSGAAVGPAANVTARSPADSVLAGAAAGASGQLAFDVAPGPMSFEATALGYVPVRTSAATLPPGSIWVVRFRLHRACPIVG